MHKIMVFLQKPQSLSMTEFGAAITAALLPFMAFYDHVRLAIRDEYVAEAAALAMITTAHPKDAIVSIISSGEINCNSMLDALRLISASIQLYKVEQYLPLSTEEPLGKMPGMCQLALLKRPAKLSREAWLDIWLNSHTQVAIETQSTFSYRQNVVLSQEGSNTTVQYDAIVEEQFPAAAMSNRKVFFNAPEDDGLFQSNERRMIESVSRFIDFTQFECLPMSEYRLK